MLGSILYTPERAFFFGQKKSTRHSTDGYLIMSVSTMSITFPVRSSTSALTHIMMSHVSMRYIHSDFPVRFSRSTSMLCIHFLTCTVTCLGYLGSRFMSSTSHFLVSSIDFSYAHVGKKTG